MGAGRRSGGRGRTCGTHSDGRREDWGANANLSWKKRVLKDDAARKGRNLGSESARGDDKAGTGSGLRAQCVTIRLRNRIKKQIQYNKMDLITLSNAPGSRRGCLHCDHEAAPRNDGWTGQIRVTQVRNRFKEATLQHIECRDRSVRSHRSLRVTVALTR